MTRTTEQRATLLARKALLQKGPLNWTDAEIDEIASFTPIPVADLTTMRHKMRRASEWSIRDLEALDALIESSPDPARLRRRLERTTTIQAGIERAKTFTGLFNRVKAQVELIDAELKAR